VHAEASANIKEIALKLPSCGRRPVLISLAASALGASVFAQARPFPARPVKIVDAFAAGGITDILARQVAGMLAEALKESVVVENRPGAGGGIAANAILQAPRDGHTLLMAAVSHAYSHLLIKGLRYDLQKDFIPVGGVASSPLVIVVRADSSMRSISDLVEAGRAPAGLAYGSGGPGTLTHLVPELIGKEAKLHLVHVAYRGTAPAVQDLLGNQVAFVADLVQTSLPHIQGGKLRALAVTSKDRIPQLPDVPTLGETVIPGFDAQAWYGLMAPAGTPAEALATLRSTLSRAVASPALSDRLHVLGSVPLAVPVEEFAAMIGRDRHRWGELISSLNIQVE